VKGKTILLIERENQYSLLKGKTILLIERDNLYSLLKGKTKKHSKQVEDILT
jgi:hypothetical protein